MSEVGIVVRGEHSSSPLLLVEVKRHGPIEEVEQKLRRYMSWTGVSLGLVVTEKQMLLLHDTYHPTAAESIERIGPFPTESIEALRVSEMSSASGDELEVRVQAWLESLRSEAIIEQTPDALKPIVEEWLAPAVLAGEVGAAGPRAA